MNLKPLGDRVVVRPVEVDDHTTSGLFLPESAKEKPQQGKIIAVGPGARNESGERIAMDVKLNDIVLYSRYAGTTIKLEGQEHLILKENDVLAVIKLGRKATK